MSHLSPSRPKWYPLDTISPADWEVIDGNTFVAVNGDYGGIWTPTANLNIGGAGVWIGDVAILRIGSTVTTDGISKRITFGSNDYFTFPFGHPGGTRTIANACIASRGTFGWDNTYACIKSTIVGSRGIFPLKVHNGAVFSQSVMTYQIASSHLPAQQIRCRVVQVDASGNVTPLLSNSTDPSGFGSPGAASASDYYAGGAFQALTLTHNLTTVDTTKYRYYADIVDESGASAAAGNQFQSVTTYFSNIIDTRFQ